MTTSTLTEARQVGKVANLRAAGTTTIAGAVAMLVGTAFWGASGTDLEAALEDGTVGDYLTDVAANGTVLSANLGFWILGIVLLGIGGTMLSTHGNPDSPATSVVRFAFSAGPAASIVFFSIWLGMVVGLAPAHVAGQQVVGTAVALGYAVTIADSVATVLIVAVGAASIAVAGRDTWVPQWLFRWGMLAAVLGGVAMIPVVSGAPAPLGLPVVPVGLGFMLASGIVAVRHNR